MRKTIITLVVLLGFGCTPKREMPPVVEHASKEEARSAAWVQAGKIAGQIYEVADTGSMKPYLLGGEFVVADLSYPYENIYEGMMTLYQARWLSRAYPPVCHFASKKLGKDWAMEGSNNSTYENTAQTAMGLEEYIGRVIAVHRIKQ